MFICTARCSSTGPASSTAQATLRLGIGGLPQLAEQSGVRQLVGIISSEGLVGAYEDGRPRPWLAESWSTGSDGLSLTVRLRQGAKFHDGTPVTASIIVPILQTELPRSLGPTFYEDVAQIVALDDIRLQIRLRHPSRFLIESLEMAIRKPGSDFNGTGPFVASMDSPVQLRANPDYYLGRPTIKQIVLQGYPSVRAAWAELLRGNLDMLYEVSVDALDSLQGSSNVAVFSYLRHYQYVIIFGDQSPFKSAEIRRELNASLNRDAIVRNVLNGHGIPSIGPVPPQHWALNKSAPKLKFDPVLAKRLTSRTLHFTCLVPADSVYERMALEIKQQLAAAGVEMRVEEVTQEELARAGKSRKFEAVLIDVIGGPSMFRVFRHFHSTVPFQTKPITSASVDVTLDRIRHAPSDDEYENGVDDFQRAIIDDPPEIFLVWGERARAVSRRFEVALPEGGRDVLNTLRLWRPATVQRLASRN